MHISHKSTRTSMPPSHNWYFLGNWLRFVLVWAFEIPWLSMAFSTTFLSFPWSMLRSCPQRIAKTIYYIMTHKMRVSVYFLLELELVPWLVCHFFQLLTFCLFIFRKYIAFPWLSKHGKWNKNIPWPSRFSMTHMNPAVVAFYSKRVKF